MTDRQEPLILAPEDSAFNAIINGVNGQSNGTSENPSITTPRGMKLDPNVTQNVLNATGPKASPRAKQVVHSLIQHIHDFARENELTMGELMAGVEMVRQLKPSRAHTPPVNYPFLTDQPSRPHVRRTPR